MLLAHFGILRKASFVGANKVYFPIFQEQKLLYALIKLKIPMKRN
jgi:hypothetical protein